MGSDIFLYTPGSAPDGILHVTPSGTTATSSFSPQSVGGCYKPLVGDFDANGVDDVFWYAPGPAADALWLFRADGTHLSKAVNVGGVYRPTVINADGDGFDDIIWYGPGSSADAMWLFGPAGGHTNKTVLIGGDYVLIPGHFQNFAEGSPQDRLIFYSATGTDSIWTFDQSANHISKPMPAISGTYRPVVGNFTDQVLESVFFYAPGSTQEQFIGFTETGAVDQYESPQVNGTYNTAVGDYDGNGYDDIAYGQSGKATVWKFNDGGFSQIQITTSTVDTDVYTTFRYTQL